MSREGSVPFQHPGRHGELDLALGSPLLHERRSFRHGADEGNRIGTQLPEARLGSGPHEGDDVDGLLQIGPDEGPWRVRGSTGVTQVRQEVDVRVLSHPAGRGKRVEELAHGGNDPSAVADAAAAEIRVPSAPDGGGATRLLIWVRRCRSGHRRVLSGAQQCRVAPWVTGGRASFQ